MGTAVIQLFIEHYGDLIWQTSHVGGHRFAPNLICLPHGIFYGRVPPEKASWIADLYMDGRLSLDNYRGAGAYPAPVQAAEHFLRLETGEDGIGAYHLKAFSSLAEDHWEVHFSGTQDHSVYHIQIESV